MKKLLETLIEKISGQKVEILAHEENGIFTYTINSPKEIMGLLIGKGGKTIRAMRSLARVRAIVDQEKVQINLQEV